MAFRQNGACGGHLPGSMPLIVGTQRETRGIKIQSKMAEFCGFFKILDAAPAGVLARPAGLEPAASRLEGKLTRLFLLHFSAKDCGTNQE